MKNTSRSHSWHAPIAADIRMWQPEDDWILLVGQHIEIYEQGKILDGGLVEDVTKVGHVLWLEMEGPQHRRLIEKTPARQVKLL
jgi:hypothetical protein